MASLIALAQYKSQRAALIAEDRSHRREFRRTNLRSEHEIEADSIMTKMPKGALLHAHLDATVNAEFLLQLAMKQPAIHVRLNEALTPASLSTNLPQFKPLPEAEFSSLASLTDASYPLGSWVPLQAARASFAPEFGGPEGFDKWVIGSMMINPSEAYGTHNTVAKSTTAFFIDADADFRFLVGADGQDNIPHREWLVMFDRVSREVKVEMTQQGRDFIGARIIYTTLRFITPEELEWYLEDCIALKKEFPHLIAGFDLVGNENALKPLIDYAEPLLHFREKQKEAGVNIPFIFHAGETLGDGTEADINLYDAILLGTKRIGHGFSLVKHPKLIKTCREKGIAVEVCPISNEILRLTSSMLMHPLPVLLNNGVPVALCSDDPSVLAASEVNGLSTLGTLARDSIEFSTLNAEDKKDAIAVFERQWNEYIEYILKHWK
ncbi:hypothetical protein NLJ89_g9548 [Agrocybe chaxingu]|uniref:Adenosine deaminase domain-containing protein n=1 Tax=Agrocybe chaxingu TaxID=84603 RepID=A0A9W8MT00_9AGAR|nr:hypothetical protein NLJ89_g9548 [Agrocybe chaxingu]